MNLKIKICGMRVPGNISEVADLKPDFMGFIFYPESPRFVSDILDPETTSNIATQIIKTGVFVDADFEEIIKNIKKYSLDSVQLHGSETTETCRRIRETGVSVIKAFNINENEGFRMCARFTESTDFFLFDASTGNHGGSGKKFNWDILSGYELSHPFFLSGGIRPDDAAKILEINNPSFYGIDLNSGFEIRPGLKDPEALKKFIINIRQNNKTT